MKKTHEAMNKSSRGEFGTKLRALRREKGMTQSGLAEKLGVGRSAVANWERGIRLPDIKYIKTLTRLFGVPADYFYGLSSHRYNIKIPDYFELDLTKLNSKGMQMIKVIYSLLISSDEYRNDI